MLIRYKDRLVDYDKPVQIYRNLNGWRQGLDYSVRQGGLVVAHTRSLTLRDCKFYVSKRGRERVLRTKRKNVHAWIEGIIDTLSGKFHFELRVTYNPYIDRFFHGACSECGRFPLFCAKRVYIGDKGVFASTYTL